MSRHDQVYENQWVDLVGKGLSLACCDCGLVHEFCFRQTAGRLRFRCRRGNRATGQARRWRKHERQEPKGPAKAPGRQRQR
jgi:hypothetical protein